MTPQLAVGGCTPRPRKLRPASTRSTKPTRDRGLDAQGPEDVRQHVTPDRRVSRGPDRVRRLDERLLPHRQRLGRARAG